MIPRRVDRTLMPSVIPSVLAIAASIGLVLVAPPAAWASSRATSELVAEAQRHSDAGEFEAALAVLEEGLRDPDASEGDLATLYWRAGEVYVFLGKGAAAKETFDRLLYLDARYEPPKLCSPRVRKAFDAARADFFASGRELVLEVLDPAPRADAPHALEARVVGLRRGMSVRALYRVPPATEWAAVELAPASGDLAPGRYLAQLPPVPPNGALEYYVEVVGADERRLKGEGARLSPRTLSLRPPALPPAALQGPEAAGARVSPWVWVGVGGAVAVATVVAVVLLAPSPATLVVDLRVVP
jgi:tetratricopeptide (TPR) repeat protein